MEKFIIPKSLSGRFEPLFTRALLTGGQLFSSGDFIHIESSDLRIKDRITKLMKSDRKQFVRHMVEKLPSVSK